METIPLWWPYMRLVLCVSRLWFRKLRLLRLREPFVPPARIIKRSIRSTLVETRACKHACQHSFSPHPIPSENCCVRFGVSTMWHANDEGCPRCHDARSSRSSDVNYSRQDTRARARRYACWLGGEVKTTLTKHSGGARCTVLFAERKTTSNTAVDIEHRGTKTYTDTHSSLLSECVRIRAYVCVDH